MKAKKSSRKSDIVIYFSVKKEKMWLWFFSTVLLGLGVLTSYTLVLFNASGGFSLPLSPSSSYVASPYWLGLPRSSVLAVVVFQCFAAVGFVMWQLSLLVHPPTRGLLADRRWLVAETVLFLLPSVLWPFAAHNMLNNNTRSVSAALGACACLWLAALGLVLLVGGTFEDKRESPVALVGILLTSTVVVVADGAGWSALALYGALYGT